MGSFEHGTDRRYRKEAFTDHGVDEFRELFIYSKDSTPPPDFLVAQVFDCVDDFHSNHPTGVVGVHGTRSVYRPCYLLAR